MNTTFTETTAQVESTMVRILLFLLGLAITVASILAHNAQQPDPHPPDMPGTTIEQST